MMMMGLSLSLHGVLDLVVAGVSMMICLWVFAFIVSVLCSAAFLHNSKDVS